MFRRTRERLERLEKLIEELTRAISAPPPATPEGPGATAIIADAFGKMAGNQTDLFAAMSDLAMKSAARRMGIRGGTKRALTAERRSDGKFAVKRLRDDRAQRGRWCCELGRDPMFRGPGLSVEMVKQHRIHEQEAEARAREASYDEQNSYARNESNASQPADDQSEPSGAGAYQNGSAPT
jgi:hypothetical protein